MDTALNTISVLPSGKEQVQLFVRKLKDEILASDKDPLKILVQLKYIEKTIAEILKDEEVDHHFLKEFLLYSKSEQVKIEGAELRQSEVGVKYFYEDSGDLTWFDLDKQIKDLTEKRKEREKFLQNIPTEGTVDPATGLYLTRPAKHSKSKVIVKL